MSEAIVPPSHSSPEIHTTPTTILTEPPTRSFSPNESGWLTIDEEETDTDDDDKTWVEVLRKMKKRSPPPDPHWQRKSTKQTSGHQLSRSHRHQFQEPTRQRNNTSQWHQSPTPTRSDYITGKGHSSMLKAMCSPSRNRGPRRATGVFITRLNPQTTSAQLAAHIYDELGLTVRPELLPRKYREYCSFFIPCGEQIVKTLLNDQI